MEETCVHYDITSVILKKNNVSKVLELPTTRLVITLDQDENIVRGDLREKFHKVEETGVYTSSRILGFSLNKRVDKGSILSTEDLSKSIIEMSAKNIKFTVYINHEEEVSEVNIAVTEEEEKKEEGIEE